MYSNALLRIFRIYRSISFTIVSRNIGHMHVYNVVEAKAKQLKLMRSWLKGKQYNYEPRLLIEWQFGS